MGASGGDAAAARGRARAARVSLVAAVGILFLKTAAWVLRGSVSRLSAAAESILNGRAAVTLCVARRRAARGPDLEHPYGHQKAEYLSSAFEASLILVAAGAIGVAALQRLWAPEPPENVGLGLLVAGAAAVGNGALALYLQRAGRRWRSAALAANARHVLTDVWTSVGVIAGVGLVAATGWLRLDPLVALVVAVQVGREGVRVLGTNLSRLMDERLPADEELVILEALRRHPRVLGFHRLRTRRSGRARFAEVDLFVDREMSVGDAHAVVAQVEDEVHARLSELTTTFHVEPFEEGRREGHVSPADEFGHGAGRRAD